MYLTQDLYTNCFTEICFFAGGGRSLSISFFNPAAPIKAHQGSIISTQSTGVVSIFKITIYHPDISSGMRDVVAYSGVSAQHCCQVRWAGVSPKVFPALKVAVAPVRHIPNSLNWLSSGQMAKDLLYGASPSSIYKDLESVNSLQIRFYQSVGKTVT